MENNHFDILTHIDSPADLRQLKTDELRVSRMSVEKSERRHMEQRAKVSQVMSVLPFIDRILYTIDHLPDDRQSPDFDAQLEYIRELTDKINEQNDLLTQWIQLRQGDLSLRIESFPLQPLFDIVAKGKTGFGMKGITLQVEPTASTVKADRVLTLPFYPDLDRETVDRICDIILSCRRIC